MIKTPSPLQRIDAAIERLKKEIDEQTKEITELEMRRQKLLSLPETCPSCKGTGEERYTDAAGDSDIRECLTCKGLGKIGPLECRRCGRISGSAGSSGDLDRIQSLWGFRHY